MVFVLLVIILSLPFFVVAQIPEDAGQTSESTPSSPDDGLESTESTGTVGIVSETEFAESVYTEETAPYEFGVLLVQYDDETFSARTTEGGEDSGVTHIPGGILDEAGTDVGPIAVVSEFLETQDIEPEVLDRFPDLRVEVIDIGDSIDPLPYMQHIANLPGVTLVQPNFLYTPDTSTAPPTTQVTFTPPSDPDIQDLWHLFTIGVLTKDNNGTITSTVWKTMDDHAATFTNKPKVGVIDTGLQVNHPEFLNAIVSVPSTTTTPNCKIPNSTEDASDDTFTPAVCTYGGYDFVDNDVDVNNHIRPNQDFYSRKDEFHGTTVASVIAAQSNTTAGVGVAQDVQIVPLRAGLSAVNGEGSFDTTAILSSIAFARLNDIPVINISLGSLHHSTCDLVYYNRLLGFDKSESYLEYQHLKEFSGLIVTSAGNEGERTGSGRFFTHMLSDFNVLGSYYNDNNEEIHCWDPLPNIISVGATQMIGSVEERWDNPDPSPGGSNYGSHVDIAAPGYAIYVTKIPESVSEYTSASNTGMDNSNYTVGDEKGLSGTSYAAPMVAGTAALILRINPSLSAQKVKDIILNTAETLPSLQGSSSSTSDDLVCKGRRLNTLAAVQKALETVDASGASVSSVIDAIPSAVGCVSTSVATTYQDGITGDTDIDDDNDGLVEIETFEELLNIRHSVGSGGYKAGADAIVKKDGCPTVDDDDDPETDEIERCTGFELMNDINLNGVIWTPIDVSATGFVFEGNNHTISNLSFSDSATDYVGFFGDVGNATIRNLTLSNVSITGDDYVGGLAGYVRYSSIINVDVQGSITGSDYVGGLVGNTSNTTVSKAGVQGTITGTNRIGGLIGNSNSDTISKSYVSADVSGTSEVGGMVGRVSGGSITDSYAMGSVNASGLYAGGVYGYLYNDTSITNSYTVATVNRSNSTSWHGGKRRKSAYGNNYAELTVTNSYRLATSSGSDQKTRADLLAGTPGTSIYTDWDTAVWEFAADKYPLLAGIDDAMPVHPNDTDSDGLIEISTVADLQAIQSKLTTDCPATDCIGFELSNDLDLTGVTWTPIGTSTRQFNVIFEGNNHTISNLSFSDSATDYAGFFGNVRNATIRNLTLSNVSITGGDYVGGLAGYVRYSSIINVDVQGSITGSDYVGGLVGNTSNTLTTKVSVQGTITGSDYVGGLIGNSGNDTISKSYVSADVSGTSEVGGMVGRVSGGSITDSYVMGSVSGSGSRIAGVYGYLYGDASITSSYLAATVNRSNSPSWHGGTRTLYYTGPSTSLTITNSYRLSTSSTGDGRTRADLVAGTPGTSIYTDWSTDVWEFAADKYPLLAGIDDAMPVHPNDTDSDGLIEISTVADLQAIQSKLTTDCPATDCIGFELSNDLDLTGVTWTPIGTSTRQFNVIFEGNNHTISNLSFSDSATDYAGFFGNVRNATIRNLTLSNVSITGGDYVGGLAGYVRYSSIINVDVQGSITGSDYVGGLVGNTSNTLTTKVSVQGTITGSDYVGGLIGNSGNDTISKSYVSADVSGTSEVGGMVGRVSGGSITDSYVMGSVSGSGSRIAGVYGYLYGDASITSSYLAATVNRSNSPSWHGGTRTLYYTGPSTSLTITNSYRLSTSSTGDGRTRADMLAGIPSDDIYTDWSTTIWNFGTTTELPTLR